MSTQKKSERVPALQDAVVEEMPVPGQFIGRSIRDLNIREKSGVSVLMITQGESDARGDPITTIPTADYVFQQGDTVLVMGKAEELLNFMRGTPW